MICGGEFQTLSRFVKQNHTDAEFIWITNGLGWNTCSGHFEEAYNNLEYVFNLHMLENGLLEEII